MFNKRISSITILIILVLSTTSCIKSPIKIPLPPCPKYNQIELTKYNTLDKDNTQKAAINAKKAQEYIDLLIYSNPYWDTNH